MYRKCSFVKYSSTHYQYNACCFACLCIPGAHVHVQPNYQNTLSLSQLTHFFSFSIYSITINWLYATLHSFNVHACFVFLYKISYYNIIVLPACKCTFLVTTTYKNCILFSGTNTFFCVFCIMCKS